MGNRFGSQTKGMKMKDQFSMPLSVDSGSQDAPYWPDDITCLTGLAVCSTCAAGDSGVRETLCETKPCVYCLAETSFRTVEVSK